MTDTQKPKKRGNPNWIKGGKSPNASGRGAAREYLNKEITQALITALEDNNHGGSVEYFQYLANEKPAIFAGILTKVMPNEVSLAVTVSLGDAMRDAQARLDTYNATRLIDITPDDQPDIVDAMVNDAKPLKVNDT